jgi:sterol-4alpha-carboxylate 3-dehydrogenase (decarboxylating)
LNHEGIDVDCRHTAGIVPGINVRYGRNPIVQHNVNKVNIEGTANMLEAAKDNRVPNFLYTSSYTALTDDLDHDYPNFKEDLPYPKSSLMYGESKVGILESVRGHIPS